MKEISIIGVDLAKNVFQTFSELRARCWRFGPGPRISISASGIYQAALTGLTRVRTRSHV